MSLLKFQKYNFLFLLLFSVINLSALTFSQEEKEWIKENPTVVLGADYSWPPYDFVDKNLQHSGISADFLTLISKKSGLTFKIEADVWSKTMKKMKEGTLDGLSCAASTPYREKFLNFTKPYVTMPLVIIVQNKRADIKNLKDLNNKVVAVNKGSYLHEWLKVNHPEIELYLTSSNNASLEAVSVSKVDAYIGNIAVATYIMKNNYLSNLKIVNSIENMDTEVSIAIDKKRPVLFSIIEKTLASIKTQERYKIRKKWFDESKEIEKNSLTLTQEERAWIDKNPIIKVGGGPDWAPFDFVNHSGEYVGIGNDYLNLISKKTGLKFEIIVDKWSNNLQKIKTKEIDLLNAVYYTQERTAFMDYTHEYFEMLDYFFVRDDLNVSKIEDLNGKRVAMPKGYAHNDILKKDFPLIKIVTVDTFSEAIDAVLENRADALFDTYSSLTYIFKKESIATIIPFKSYRGHNTVKLHMSTAKGERVLLSIMNKALKDISLDEKKKIQKKWLGTSEKAHKPTLSFSDIEKEWIKKNPTLTYSEINWEPMSIITDSEMTGVMREYLEKITLETGIVFEFKSSSSWPDVIEKFKNKEIDIIPGIGASDFEAKLGLTSDVYANFPFVLVTRNSESFISNIDELSGKTIAVPKYWTSYNYLKEQKPNIKILETKNIFEALEAVKSGKAYAFLGHMAIGMHYVGTYYPESLHIAGKVAYNFNHKILIQADNEILLGIINKVIHSMSKEEHLKIKDRWLQVKVKEAQNYTLIYQIVSVLALIIAGTLYWNRKLTFEIKERHKIEKALEVEKENFKVLFEKVSDGNLIIQDGKFVTCNAAALSMLGLKNKEEILSSTPDRWSPYLQEDGLLSSEKARAMIELCLENGNHRFEWIHKDINEKEFWVDVGLTKIIYEGNDAIYVVWRDIEEQKLLENSLKRSELQMRTLINRIPLHVIVTSYDGKVILANPQSIQDYELDEKNLSEINILDFYEDGKERDAVVTEIRERGKVDNKVIKFIRPDGVHSMMLSILPISYDQENVLLSIGVDLSERLKMEEDLREAKNIAELANKSKSEFLANMSHEIRTPMNAIIGFTELLSEQIEQPKLKSYVSTIQSASNTLLTLINDILDLSKIEAGKLKINKTATDIVNLSNEVSTIFTMSVKNKGLDLIVEVDESIPKTLLIDEIRLRQILLNIIGNAVKFTQKGFIKLSVTAFNIDKHLSKLDLEFRVKDTGIGIPANQLEKIFHEFEQTDGQDSRKFGGTGLGLSISQRLSKMMDGEISVESVEGEGTTFSICFYGIDIASIAESKTIDTQMEIKNRSIIFNRAKILVVDDIEDNRELIIKNFEDTEIEIITANNGLEALESFKREKPDLILMDIRMPKMDGYEASAEIKKISSVPIIALTASVMQDESEMKKRENFDGYLRKPVLRADLFKELSNFLTYEQSEVLSEDAITVELSQKTKLNIGYILKILEEDMLVLHKEVLESNSIADITKMMTKIKSLADEYDIGILKDYAESLNNAIDAFDLIKIDSLLKEFNSLVVKLHRQI